MKIAVMTVPFNNNYGGFLQAFALKHVLLDMGHDVIFIIRRRDHQRVYLHRWLNLFMYVFRIHKSCQFLIDYRQKKMNVNTDKFVNKYLKPWTKEFYRSNELEECKKLDADVFIVGSDQCWRAKYAPNNIDDYFFKFLTRTGKKRISYAASFGTDVFEYSQKMQSSASSLLKEFSSISVRESSGIHILETYFNVKKGKAVEVLDPTFLPCIEAYKDLIKDYPIDDSDYLFAYILDDTADKKKVVESVAGKLALEVISQKAQTGNVNKPIEPVELWLSRIANASFVVTDSFHGTVFSILFNKPFVVYGNKERGAARFETLLSKFQLLDRYVDSIQTFQSIDLFKEIEWSRINRIIAKKKIESINFLTKALEK